MIGFHLFELGFEAHGHAVRFLHLLGCSLGRRSGSSDLGWRSGSNDGCRRGSGDGCLGRLLCLDRSFLFFFEVCLKNFDLVRDVVQFVDVGSQVRAGDLHNQLVIFVEFLRGPVQETVQAAAEWLQGNDCQGGRFSHGFQRGDVLRHHLHRERAQAHVVGKTCGVHECDGEF